MNLKLFQSILPKTAPKMTRINLLTLTADSYRLHTHTAPPYHQMEKSTAKWSLKSS